jgi:hypothetical protein
MELKNCVARIMNSSKNSLVDKPGSNFVQHAVPSINITE